MLDNEYRETRLNQFEKTNDKNTIDLLFLIKYVYYIVETKYYILSTFYTDIEETMVYYRNPLKTIDFIIIFSSDIVTSKFTNRIDCQTYT